jgi:hypothetical protein
MVFVIQIQLDVKFIHSPHSAQNVQQLINWKVENVKEFLYFVQQEHTTIQLVTLVFLLV